MDYSRQLKWEQETNGMRWHTYDENSKPEKKFPLLSVKE